MAYVAGDQEDDEEKKKGAQQLGGEAEASPGSGQAQLPGAQPYTQVGFASAKNIFDKNKGGADQYDVTQPFQEDLGQSKEALKTNFGKLTESIGKQVAGQKYADNDVSDAIAQGSNSASFGKIMGALKPQAVTGQLDAVQNKYTGGDVSSLNTAPGVQAAIANQAQKKGVQNYSQGMGALDAAIYQASPQNRMKIHELSKSYGDFDKEKEDYNKQAASAIEKSNKELSDSAEKLRGTLGGQVEGIRRNSTVANEGSAAYQRAMAAQQQARAIQDKQRQDILNKVASGIGDQEVRNDFLNYNRANVGQGFGSIKETGPESYTAEDASKFNNIMALLGKTDRVNASDPIKADFNAGGFEDSLKAAIGKSESSVKDRREAAARAAQLKENEERLKQLRGTKAGDAMTKKEVDSLTPYERSILEMSQNAKLRAGR